MRKKEFNELPEVIDILGLNFNLSNQHKLNLQSIEKEFGKIRSANAKSVACFIKYDLDNWNDRLKEIKTLKNTITEKRYILLMGEIEGSKFWENISTKKKDSQTEQNYIEKYGEKEGKEIWNDINNRRAISAFNINYWLKQGLSKEEAKKKISALSKKGSKIGNEKQTIQRENNYEEWAKKMPNTKYYWMEQGYSEEESLEKVTERQTTFSKETCISKYGKKEGLKIWKERQEKWIYSITNSDTCTKIGYASQESLKYFNPIIKLLEKHKISYRLGIDNNSEFRLFGNDRLNLYDFVIEDLKICFEFNGETFHPNPKWKKLNPKKWDSWIHPGNKMRAEEKFDFDSKKLEVIKSKGYIVKEIWSSDDFNKQLNEMKSIILERISQT